jgi:hypothetical protein
MSVQKPAEVTVASKTADPVVTTTAAVKTKITNPVASPVTSTAAVKISIAATTKTTAVSARGNATPGADTIQPVVTAPKPKTVKTNPVTVVGAATNAHSVYL